MAKKIVICISGMAGCGKSTLAKRIAAKYGLKYLSGGDTLKALAIEEGFKPAETGWWETDEGARFLRRRMKVADFDKKVDRKLIDRAKKQGNVVLDSWTMPWLLDEGFKIWLEASRDVRARRLAERDGIDFKKALEVMVEKEGKTRAIYRRLYGFDLGNDLSPFDLILDTDLLDANEVFRSLCVVIDRLVFEKNSRYSSD
jgi:cytidylate kinase